MATVAKAVVSLEAQSAAFSKGTARAAADADGLAGHIQKVLGVHVDLGKMINVAAFVETAAVAVDAVKEIAQAGIEAGERVAEWVAGSLESANRAVNLAQSLGYGVETIGAMGAAAKAAGGSAEELQTGLAKLTKEIGAATEKGGEGAAAFAKMGLNARELAGMTGDQQIRAVADALANIPNHAERAAAAVQLFGRSGAGLLPLFSQGSRGIDEAVAKGLKLGDVLSGFDASRLAAAERAADEVGRAFEGVKNQLAIALAPVIQNVADGLVNLLPPADRMRSALVGGFTVAVEAGAKVVDVLDGVAAVGLRVEAFNLRVEATYLRIVAGVTELGVRTGRWVASLPLVGTVINDAWAVIRTGTTAVIGAVEWVWAKVQAVYGKVDALLAKVRLSSGVSEVAGSAADRVDGAADMMQRAAAALDATTFSDKASGWLGKIGQDSTGAAGKIANGLNAGGGAITEGIDANAKKVTETLAKLTEQAAKVGDDPRPLIDLDNLAKGRAAVEDVAARARGAASNVRSELGSVAPATAAKLIDLDNLRSALGGLDAANGAIDAAQARQAAAAAKLRAELPDAPARLVDVANLAAAGDALTAARKQAGDMGRAVAEQFARVRAAAAATGEPRALVDLNNLQGAVRSLAQVSAAAEGAYDQQAAGVAKVRAAVAGIGKPKELIDLENLGASAAQLAQAGVLLDQIAHKKIGEGLAAMAKEVADFGLSEGQKKLADLKAGGANDAELARAASLAAQLDTMQKQKGVAEDIARLQKEAATAGMTEAQKRLADLKDKGATPDQVKQAAGLQASIDKMAAWRKEQEDANRLIEQSATPMEKYHAQIERVRKLFADGLITAQQQAGAIDKARKEMGHEDKDAGAEKHAAATVRRFDFRLPADAMGKPDAAQKALAVAQENLKSQKQQEYYLNQLYNFGNADQQNQDVVVDF